jgi:hypothetical protein
LQAILNKDFKTYEDVKLELANKLEKEGIQLRQK